MILRASEAEMAAWRVAAGGTGQVNAWAVEALNAAAVHDEVALLSSQPAGAAGGAASAPEARKAAAARVERETGSRPRPSKPKPQAVCRHGYVDCRVCRAGRFAA
jgi:hypothetical protein